MRIKGFGLIALGIHSQSICGDMGTSNQAAVYGTGEQSFTKAAPLFIGATGEASQAEAGHWIVGEFFPVGQQRGIDFGGAEGVVAQDSFRCTVFDQYIHRTNATLAMLIGITL